MIPDLHHGLKGPGIARIRSVAWELVYTVGAATKKKKIILMSNSAFVSNLLLDSVDHSLMAELSESLKSKDSPETYYLCIYLLIYLL